MTLTDELSEAGLEEWLIASVDRLARGDATTLESYLTSVGEERQLDGTMATCRCHFIARDAHGRVRLEHFAKKLAQQVTDYCIPRSRITEARKHFEKTGSTEFFSDLQSEAKSLFAGVEGSGEAGELLVFFLLERLLNIPQLFCKMSLKTHPSMHIHGIDGVHVKALAGERLAVYWCESKVYADFASAVRDCLRSLAPFLLDNGLGATERDITLLRTRLDTGDPVLDKLLVKYFVEDEIEVTKREFRGASLVGFALDEYPDPEHGEAGLPEELRSEIDGWYEAIGKRVENEGIETFELEVFCLPMPSADEFRRAFREQLGLA